MEHADITGMPPDHRYAFTLIELLMSIAVIAILAGMLFPAIKVIQASADASYCKNNLRQAFLANHGYSTDNEGYICPSSIAIPPAITVEIPWAQFLAPYAEKTGIGGISNGDKIPTIAICKVFLRRFPQLLDPTLSNIAQIRAWGYARNPILMAQNGSAAGSTYGVNDYSSSCDAAGVQASPYFRYFTWSDVSQPSNRLFLGEGYFESSGQLHSPILQTGITPTAANLKYQYIYQWGTSVTTGSGSVQIGSMPQSPAGVNTDVHRGKRSYLMCDGSARAMTDSYADNRNQVFLSITDPQHLP